MAVASLYQSAVFFFLVLTVFASTGVFASPLRAGEVKVTSNFLLDEDSHNLSPLTDGLLKFVPAASGPVAMAPEVGVAFILAAKRTRRPDVLEKFRPYKGGWDMTNKHYWASVSFTGAAGFILAVVWLISFAVALIAFRCCKWRILFIEKASERPHQQICLLLLLLFTCAASTGCALLSVGQDEFHDEVFDTLKYVVNQSDFVVQILGNVTDYLSLAKKINVDEYYISLHVQNEIDKLDFDLKSATHTISVKTVENSEKTRRVINDMRRILIVVAAIMLLISIIGFALSVLRHRHAIYVFITSGWLLVAVTLVLCGAFVILNNAVGDTCTAMDEWVHYPQAETALSNILPCVDQQTTNRTLYQSKEVILQIVSVVNSVIRSIAHSNNTRVPHVFNQSEPSIPLLCSPYNSQLLRRPCHPQEVSFGNASQVWQQYVCDVSNSGSCAGAGRITPLMYTQLVTAVNASYALDHYAPLLLSLQDCKFVCETFNSITDRYCPNLERNLRLVISGLVLISVGVMLCLILWIVYANRPQRDEVFVTLSEGKVASDDNIPLSRGHVST